MESLPVPLSGQEMTHLVFLGFFTYGHNLKYSEFFSGYINITYIVCKKVRNRFVFPNKV